MLNGGTHSLLFLLRVAPSPLAKLGGKEEAEEEEEAQPFWIVRSSNLMSSTDEEGANI